MANAARESGAARLLVDTLRALEGDAMRAWDVAGTVAEELSPVRRLRPLRCAECGTPRAVDDDRGGDLAAAAHELEAFAHDAWLAASAAAERANALLARLALRAPTSSSTAVVSDAVPAAPASGIIDRGAVEARARVARREPPPMQSFPIPVKRTRV